MGKITFNIAEGGLGRDLPNKDNYSGLLFDDASKPASYGTDTVKKVRTLKDAEDLGLTSALFPVAHYQVSEYFRVAKLLTGLAQGHLWVGFFDGGVESANYDGTQLRNVQNAAEGEIRRVGVFLKGNYDSGFITESQSEAQALADENKPLSVLLNADFSGTTLAVLTDLRTLASPRVSVNIGMDKGGTGGALFTSEGYTVSSVGATLAAKAFGNIHESIGWTGKFNLISTNELNTIQFGTGESFESQSQVTLDDVFNKGYIFLKKATGVTGTFQEGAPTSTAATSDFAYWQNQEVIDKTIRQVRISVFPLIDSPLYVDADTGQLAESTIQVFKTSALSALDQLARDGNISTKADGELPQYSVIIDPNQDVLATNKIVLTISIVPVGWAQEIEINIGFTANIS